MLGFVVAPNAVRCVSFKTDVACLKPRVDRLALKGKHSENAFMYPAERLFADESLKTFNA
jgi:hypothetical protein